MQFHEAFIIFTPNAQRQQKMPAILLNVSQSARQEMNKSFRIWIEQVANKKLHKLIDQMASGNAYPMRNLFRLEAKDPISS